MPGVSDIRLAVSWRDHPKRTKLQRRLGADGVVAVIDLWCWVGEERPSGRLEGMSAEDVEIAAAWRGAPGRLVEELLDLQLLDKDDGGTYVIHSWEDRQGWAVGAARRSESARANAIKSWEVRRARTAGTAPSKPSDAPAAKKHAPASESDAPALRNSCGRNAPSPSPSPSPSPESLSLRDPSATGSGNGLQAQARMFSAGDVERLYSEVTSKTAHPQACAPVAQAIVVAAASKACDPADLTRKVFSAFPDYRTHCKTLGWDVHPSLRGVEAHIDRLLLWLDGEKPVGQPPGRSPPQANGDGRKDPEERLPPAYRPSVPRVRTTLNSAPASTSAGNAAGVAQPERPGPGASSFPTARTTP